MAVGNFLAELKRRHVYRAGGAYAVVAFGLIEIVSNVAPMFDLPNWVGRAVVFVLIVGFPVTLLAAWMIEAKPVEDAHTHTASKLDFALMGALVLVVGLLIYQQVAPAQKAADVAAPGAGVSIAVLPFVNLSGDPSQEFFSDGMTEEITSALAKVQSLTVMGRTSAFEFKGQNRDLRAIGQALGVRYLLEGSVRKSGSRVRITGQLIRAENGAHIWTENYDRELTDIFATQDDIARAIAGALQAPLGLKAGESLVAARAIDPENYQKYLRARALYRTRGGVGGTNLGQAASLLEELTAAEPAYAPAWALLAATYQKLPTESSRPDMDAGVYRSIADGIWAKARAAAQRALALDPRNAEATATLGQIAPQRQAQEDLLKRALELAPSDPDVMHDYSIALAEVGRVKEALVFRQKLLAMEPLVPAFNSNTVGVLWADGQAEAALALAKALPPTRVDKWNRLARIYAGMGRYSEAADALLSAPAGVFLPDQAQAAAQLLRKAPARIPPQDLPVLARNLTFVYLYAGAPERFRLGNIPGFNEVGWTHPSFAPYRKTATFKAWARDAGLVDYWRARGWPDLCRPVGADDFVCD